MKIAFDIDNTITNLSEELIKEALIFDKTIRNAGIINDDKFITRGMFDWNDDETILFEKCMVRCALNATLKEGAKEIINKLYDEGNEIFFISSRDNPHWDNTNPYELTTKYLKEHQLKYHQLIITKKDKTKALEENKIDVFIDDVIFNCLCAKKLVIKTFLLNTKYNIKDIPEGIQRVNTLSEFYNKIKGEK